MSQSTGSTETTDTRGTSLQTHKPQTADIERVDQALEASKGALVGSALGAAVWFALQEELFLVASPVIGAGIGAALAWIKTKNRQTASHLSGG